ncbi:MAG TPA: S1 RNA-binding domain-containing protein [Kofleriaceae bacterium]|nr:S1 RNA-binding domain-containing protein [Kofleriaceae bacterium]
MNDGGRAGWRWIGAGDAVAFANDVLFAPSRKRPVVAVTTDAHGHLPIDVDRLARELDAQAELVALETGEATWALSDAMPDRLDVYGGAVRIWWPGLTRESDPYEHPLFFVKPGAAAGVARRLLETIGGAPLPPAAPERRRPERVERPERAERPERVERPERADRADRADPWAVLEREYQVGDVVRGRVCAIRDSYVLVELLPNAALICHISELSTEFVHHPADVVALDERVNVEILALDPRARRGEVSLRRAGWAEPRPAIAPGPGLPPFLDDEPPPKDDDHALQLAIELENANADRAELRRRLKEANEQAVSLRKELRSAEDRERALVARDAEADPLASETAFLAAVRVEYARRVNESDRVDYPLLRMRVGREFLDRLRALEGVPIEKVIEVCAQVASGRAHLFAGREVHELHEGEGGTPARVRERDGAKAWRCALQVNSASARRLHWWEIPARHPRLVDGRIIEFASVAVHDDVSIPA